MSNSARRRRIRSAGVVLGAIALTLLACAFFTSRQPRVYRASTTVVVTPNTDVEGMGDVLRSLETLERRTVIATFARVPATAETRAAAARQLGRADADLSPYRVEASVLPNTNIIKIDVEGPDAAAAAVVANAVSEATRDEVRRMYRIFTLRTLAAASPAPQPVRPDPRRNYVVAGILGLFLGVLAAVLIERLLAPAARA